MALKTSAFDHGPNTKEKAEEGSDDIVIPDKFSMFQGPRKRVLASSAAAVTWALQAPAAEASTGGLALLSAYATSTICLYVSAGLLLTAVLTHRMNSTFRSAIVLQLGVAAAASGYAALTAGLTAVGGLAGALTLIALFAFREARRASQRADPTLQERIASFYDETSQVWEEVWGEHMHHGYYTKGEAITDHSQNIEYQEVMIKEILKYGGADKLEGDIKILDAGCGIGGSSRSMARMYPKAQLTGITLSPYQCERALALTEKAGLRDRVNFKVEDAMHTSFPDNTFDVVYSMESGEHMPDKKGFVEECMRVLKPGGKLVMAVWCHREVPPQLEASETALLENIYRVYALPYVCQLSDFDKFAGELGMENSKFEDWTEYIKPFWWQVIKKAVSIQGVLGLINSGWTAIYGAWAAWWMHKAVERKVFVFGAFTASKPATA